MGEALVVAEGVTHHFGKGALRKRILDDVSFTVEPGEIVIVTGPSGSGKTTLLTLIGALRSTQGGSLRVLGEELRNASERTLVRVRRQIGYIFQLHNLVDALTVAQNVQLAFERTAGVPRREAVARARDMIEAVGLAEHAAKHPDQLSGGQKQRVAIARALARRPRIILADEPTASLDKQSGREVVERMQALAKREGCAVLLVTHDNRILDIADRIIHLEEGRLSGYAEAVLASAQQLLGTLAKSSPTEDLTRQVDAMSPAQFAQMIERVTAEAQQMLEVITMSTDDAFEILLERVLDAFTYKIGQLVHADRASLMLADEVGGELWAKVAQPEGGRPAEIRIPIKSGIAGHVYRTGAPLNVADAYAVPMFNRDVDARTGYRTRAVLCVPLFDRGRRPFAVMTALNKADGGSFDAADERALAELGQSIGVILETWNQANAMRRRLRAATDAASSPSDSA